MSMNSIEKLAADFCSAFYEKRWPNDDEPDLDDLSIRESYQVQDLAAHMRVASGETVVGFKVGCTSQAIREQFGLNEPIFGRLFQPHTLESHENVDWSAFANCAIEPEMVLKIGKDLHGEGLTDAQLIDSIAYVSPGIELHDFAFWKKPPSTQELICSGGIHAGLIIGSDKVDPRILTFRDELFQVRHDGVEVTAAPASEIMGGPLNSLRWLVGALDKHGVILEKGSFVIPGSPVELVTIHMDCELTVAIQHVGDLTICFQKQ